MATTNTRRVALERSLKGTHTSDVQKNVCEYLRILRASSYNRLITPVQTEDINSIIGELRVIQKLLNVLELGNEPLDIS